MKSFSSLLKNGLLYLFISLVTIAGSSLQSFSQIEGKDKSAPYFTIPALFSDNMVLQREMPIPFWGTALPEEQVYVTLMNQTVYAKADSKGKWMLRLAPLEAGGPYKVTVIARKDTLVLKNVWIGDVWIASGQSNMEMPIAPNQWFTGIKNYQEEIANSEDPLLRVFTVTKNTTADKPQIQVIGKWQKSNPENSGGFTAVGYFFGRGLRKELGIPIGIINTSYGASPAQAWTSYETLSNDPDFRIILDNWNRIDGEYKAKIARFKTDSILWASQASKALSEGKQVPPGKPQPPRRPILPQKRPASLYNGMIAPLIPYAMKGAIWYQGEGNSDNPRQYEELFPAMILNWRHDWGQGDFPFLFVQLPNFMKPQTQPSEGGWAGLREAQTKTLNLPNTGMITTIDLGDEKDIHPKNKQDVGYRLAQCALAKVYGREVPYSGPIFSKMKIKRKKIYLYFKETDGGLIARGYEKLNGFAIAGEDHNFSWARANIRGDKVIVYSNIIKAPVAVRYSWASNPIGNLFSKSGLPASPFRTDNWD
jgi:sialate O-acetylesterase